MKTIVWLLTILTITSMAIALPTVRVHKTDLADNSFHTYIVEVVSGPVGIYDNGDVFKTFCLEREEHTGNALFNADIGTSAIEGGVGPAGDPLDIRTAYLYSEFLNGNLAGLGYNYTSYTSFYTLQNVIWELEGEGSVIGLGSGLGADLLAYANATPWTDIDNIRVLVLYNLDGSLAQDMLVKIIPAPGAIVLAGIGTALVGWMRRRKA